MTCCSSGLTSRLYVCYRWKILLTNQKRRTPIRVLASVVDCPRGLNSSWAVTFRKHSPSRSSIMTWRKIRSLYSHFFLFYDWSVLEKKKSPGREEWVTDQSRNSYGSTCSFCLLIIHGEVLDSQSVLSSLRGAELPGLQVSCVYKKIYRLLKRKSK